MAHKFENIYNLRLDMPSQIDKQKPLNFTFDGKHYVGYQGDTLASALIANGVCIVGRSFKYHRPRGIYAAGAEEPNAILKIGTEPYIRPNMQATRVDLYEGLVANSVNAWPNANFDLAAPLGLAKPFFVAGFYYKMFKWPSWKFWSPIVRLMAGLSKAPKQPDPDEYDYHHAHTDILIVGAGVAGLSAALKHGQAGEQVLLVEQDKDLGGALLFEKYQLDGKPALEWVAKTQAKLQKMPNVTIVTRATVTGYYDDNFITISERLRDHLGQNVDAHIPRERFWHLRAKQVIIATGAIERPLVFCNNDRPNIMLASAVRHYANRYGVTAGKKIFIATNNDDAYRTALDLHAAGAHIVGIADARKDPQGGLVKAAQKLGITIYSGHAVVNTTGMRGLKSISISQIDLENNQLDKRQRDFRCDVLAVSGGYSPVVHLHSQSGGKLRFDEAVQAFVPSLYVQKNICIGAANGVFDLGEILADSKAKTPKIKTDPLQAFWDLPSNVKKIHNQKRWVDLLHDVTATDVALAARENYASIEHFKRYTTTGMAMDQGKTSNVNALAILGQETDRKIPEVGTTKFRPPYTPVTMGAMAARSTGAMFSPLRHLAAHDWHAENGAKLEDYGGWLRPAYYAQSGETEQQAVDREVLSVRKSVGMLDYSPLGKIMLKGRDAAEFLDYFYVSNVQNLKPGRARYSLALNEGGTVIDDGLFIHLAKNHFMLTTTSGGAAKFAATLEEWRQCEWPHMDVVITNITNGWGCISLQGSSSRDLLAKVFKGDLSPENLPHMSIIDGDIEGQKVQILRTSFTGELGYEIYMQRAYMQSMWELIFAAGQEFDLTPFGIEALMVMRTEKGYIHIGVDSDSSTIPDDLGFGRIARKKTIDYIGKRSLFRPAELREDREILVGLKAIGDKPLRMGGIILAPGHDTAPAPMDGRVTSSYHSATLGHPVALALLKNGGKRAGEIVKIFDLDGVRDAEVVATCFYDAKAEKLNA